MTNRSLIQLTDEKFQEIYTNEELLINISTAHGCYDSSHQLKYFKAFGIYPDAYIVTRQQIDLAKQELARLKAEKITNLKAGELVFIGTGMDYESRFDSDIYNHIIRATFKNDKGRTYFVEFSKNGNTSLKDVYFWCTFSINEDWRVEQEAKSLRLMEKRNSFKRYSKDWEEAHKEYKANDHQRYYNAFGIEHKGFEMQFTKENLLNLINETFECSYTSLSVDRFIFSTSDIVCFC